MRATFIAVVLLLAAGCGNRQLKAAGAACVATSECEEGLTCDFGQSPAVCAGGQSGGDGDGDGDAAVPPDGNQVPIDGAPPPADAGIDAT